MKRETDLAQRVAELERQLQVLASSPHKRRRVIGIGGWLLFVIVTANLWLFWSALADRRASRVEHHFWVVCQPGATAQQRRDSFSTLVRAGNREWRSARLKRLKLKGIDLAGAELEWIDMEGSDLSDANFRSANLRRAGLELTKLVRVNFSLADLSEAFLRKVDLTGADLSRANLRSASLEQSDLVEASFERADMTESNLLLAILTRADLRRANLSWANLDAADLTGADLEDAVLEGASIRDTFFGDSNWWRAKGLPSVVIERFKKEFAPGNKAPVEFQEDYQKWLADQ